MKVYLFLLLLFMFSCAELVTREPQSTSEVSARFLEYREKKSSLSGPNCYNFSLYLLGMSEGLHYQSEKSMDVYRKSFCREIFESEKKLGDLGLIYYDPETLAHSFIVSHEDLVFHKASFYNMFPYEEKPLEEVAKFFGLGFNAQSFIRYYRCQQFVFPMSPFYQELAALQKKFTHTALHFLKDEKAAEDYKFLQEELKSFLLHHKEILSKDPYLESLVQDLSDQIKRWMEPDEDD